ncbi:MAG: M1 family aminopeptidase, partial [Bacteroidia bacterium]|nr:M1 family aminopeptidase [Bacteroidia bacterium]
HAVDFYSRYTGIKYPWPVVTSVNGPVHGMEYPTICFNGPRPDPDGSYGDAARYALVSVVIHEVGHNFFPMIVNSDERRWMWMDEGVNSFVQYLCEQEWERDYPSRRGPAEKIVSFMRDPAYKLAPIMTPADQILKMGDLTYGKTAAGLNILRETIIGRERFDAAFQEYCRRWAFKRPYPADFFRTLKQASGVDIDWFVNGWFFGTDPVDLAIESVIEYTVANFDPDAEDARLRTQASSESLSQKRNRDDIPVTVAERDPKIETAPKPSNQLSDPERKRLLNLRARLSDQERAFLDAPKYFYQVEIANLGGMIMPWILEFRFKDGSRTEVRVGAEIWRFDAQKTAKTFVFDKPVESITLDPWLETPDTDRQNNRAHAPFAARRIVPKIGR